MANIIQKGALYIFQLRIIYLLKSTPVQCATEAQFLGDSWTSCLSLNSTVALS